LVIAKHRVLVLLAAALALAACSVSRLAYLNAPPLALWYIGGYVSMSDTQKTLVRDRLTRAIAWHRQAELPQYQHSIEALISMMDAKVSPEDARATYARARDFYHRSVEHLLPDVADFVLTLDDAQIAQIEKKLGDDNKKLVKESLDGSADDRRTKRAKKFIQQFEDWTGPLSGAQRGLVADGTRNLADNTDERIADRRYREAEIVKLIRSHATRDQMVAKLRTLLIDTESWRRPEYTAKLRERDDRLIEVVSELSATLTPEQRASVQRRMRGYVKEISSIVAKG
jgi:hypothetical protein